MAFYYKMAPVSAQVVELVEYDPRNNVVRQTQNVDISQLNEAALHRFLFILKRKIDPKTLGTVTESWRALPDNPEPKVSVPLQKLYSAGELRKLLSTFLDMWAKESLETRNLGGMRDKFAEMPAWEQLHTVKPRSIAKGELVLTQSGVAVRPEEECTQKLAEFARRIAALAATVEDCERDFPNDAAAKQACAARGEAVAAVREQAASLSCAPK